MANEISSPGSQSSSAGSSTPNITHGRTLLVGDVIYIFIHANGSSITCADNNGATPTTELWDGPGETGSSNSVSIYRRVCGAAEPANYTFNLSSSTGWNLLLKQFRGCYWVAPEDVAPAAAGKNEGSSGTTATSASVNTLTGEAISICCFASDGTTTYSGPTNGYGNLLATASGRNTGMTTKTIPRIGATGTTALTISGAGDDWWVMNFTVRSAYSGRTILI